MAVVPPCTFAAGAAKDVSVAASRRSFVAGAEPAEAPADADDAEAEFGIAGRGNGGAESTIPAVVPDAWPALAGPEEAGCAVAS
jgi:hypothetical protein